MLFLLRMNRFNPLLYGKEVDSIEEDGRTARSSGIPASIVEASDKAWETLGEALAKVRERLEASSDKTEEKKAA